MRLFIIILLLPISFISKAQQTLNIKVTDENKIPVAASIILKGTSKGYSTDTAGIAQISFAGNGNYTLVTTAVGFDENVTKIKIPYNSDTLEIVLQSHEYEME